MSRNVSRFVRLSVDYADDPRIRAAGELAEVTFIRLLCVASRVGRDGYLDSRSALESSHRSPKRLLKLCEVGLISEVPGGYMILSYTKWQESRDEIAHVRATNAARQQRYRDRHAQRNDAESNVTRDGVINATYIDKTRQDIETSTKTSGSSLALRSAPLTAQTLIAEWIDAYGQQPKRQIGQVAKELNTLLSEGLPYAKVRAGFSTWAAGSTHPSAIASYVARAGQANGKPSTTDTRVASALALADKYERLETS